MKKIINFNYSCWGYNIGYATTPYAEAKAAETSNTSLHIQAFSNQALFDTLEKDGHDINDILTKDEIKKYKAED
jgi:prenyltransferase beta subunit